MNPLRLQHLGEDEDESFLLQLLREDEDESSWLQHFEDEAEAKALALYVSSWRGRSDATLSFSSWRGEGKAARSSSSRSCTIVLLSKLHNRRPIEVVSSLSSRRAEAAASMKPSNLNIRNHQ